MHIGKNQFTDDHLSSAIQKEAEGKSLNSRCLLQNETVSQDDYIDKTNNIEQGNEQLIQEMYMSAMIAQYRVEAIVGGDSDDLSNPMYVSEW